MIYCSKCGAEIYNDAVFCPKCGCQVGELGYNTKKNQVSIDNNSMITVTKVFMVIGCVCSAFIYLIPLIWTIPMTISYFNKINNNEPISTGFKVCCLLFVSGIAGILMLCDNS